MNIECPEKVPNDNPNFNQIDLEELVRRQLKKLIYIYMLLGINIFRKKKGT